MEPEPDLGLRDFLEQGGSLLFLFVAGIYGSLETIGLILFQMLSHFLTQEIIQSRGEKRQSRRGNCGSVSPDSGQ